LGAVDGFAPLGAYIGVSGTITPAALLVFAAVTIWVAGFDVIYALMDRDVDVAQNIRSIPARFGAESGRRLPILLHLLMVLLLALAGVLAQVGPVYYAGVALAALLAWYENRLFGISKNLFVLNERVFVSNMAFSVSFLVTTVGGFAWHA
jgi:4-hydroxybenzoate polyprenyltransferase